MIDSGMHGIDSCLLFRASGCAVERAERLLVVFRLIHDDAVDQDAGDLDLARV